jgi:hypothetical protein
MQVSSSKNFDAFFPNLQIQYTDQLPSSRLNMVIVDNELSLVIEEKKYRDPVGHSYVLK